MTGDPAEVERKFGILRKHCEDAGRDCDSIKRTVLMHSVLDETDEKAAARVPQWAPFVHPGDISTYGLIGTVDTVREPIAAYGAVGVQEFVLTFPDTVQTGLLQQFAEEFIGRPQLPPGTRTPDRRVPGGYHHPPCADACGSLPRVS